MEAAPGSILNTSQHGGEDLTPLPLNSQQHGSSLPTDRVSPKLLMTLRKLGSAQYQRPEHQKLLTSHLSLVEDC